MLPDGTPTPEAQLVKDKTLVLTVTVHTLTFRKTIPHDHPHISVGDAKNKKRFGHRKRTLEGPEIEALRSQEDAIREWVSQHSLAGDLGRNYRLIALGMMPMIDEQLEAFVAERKALVEKLIEKYPVRIDEAKPELGVHWNIHDYPRVKKLRQSFKIEWTYRTTLDLPPTMEEIDGVIAARERKKHAKEAQRILDTLEHGVIDTFHRMIQHMTSRLGVAEDGSLLTFRQTTVENLKEFVKWISLMNVRERDDINELAAQAEKLLDGVTVEKLRQKGEFRDQLRVQMDALAKKLDPLLIRASARKFYLSEGEEE